ncbi:MAG: hypothetical protein EWV49_13085 [Microcystis aeruginosa Ma_QC_Ch_20071001_S25]|uniref:Uncharacterized protein n=2 Tax=Microcystis aeruginosa TaxID=1126 RepID=A0A552FF75_MICAE|nr:MULTISPECIES: hypothetical protein [unclassified Microcystis]MCA2928718.1 hypothetical protein [Microcystis sp. M020S1]MCA2934634.1 hypothetical protein [Microcystis sp. M015S1]MCU7243491.1 hypothetical protein [Microcystis aeruginosa WS75]NCR21246.1 hypothetical protein [Microcystis aeruginosa L111-01]NCR57180.1 hypothetical protein [Microcystis aeruginosa LL13-06]NCS10980.1 hypothetical protein [Microcystis aeruginosa G13-09]NCS20009.1 hypothetical protein [Microcystis aeruginosa G11-06
MQITLKERIESIQVGSISALAFLVPYLLFLIVDRVFLGESITVIGTFVKISGAIISGFLFGVTYRYVVRNDDNPHLKDGTVAAFALVRGLVPLQLSTDLIADSGRLSLFLGESFICFLSSRLLLELTKLRQ